MNYQNCHKTPSKGGMSAKDVKTAYKNSGLDPKGLTKAQMCDELLKGKAKANVVDFMTKSKASDMLNKIYAKYPKLVENKVMTENKLKEKELALEYKAHAKKLTGLNKPVLHMLDFEDEEDDLENIEYELNKGKYKEGDVVIFDDYRCTRGYIIGAKNNIYRLNQDDEGYCVIPNTFLNKFGEDIYEYILDSY